MKGPTKAFIATVIVSGGIVITAILADYAGVVDLSVTGDGLRFRVGPAETSQPALTQKGKN